MVSTMIVTVSEAQAAPPTYQVLSTITLPSNGSGAAVDSSRGLVYVALRGTGQVLVYNADTLAQVRVLSVPNEPYNLDVDEATGYVYVSQYSGNGVQGSMSVLAPGATSIVATVNVGLSPVGVRFSPTRQVVYLANYSSNFISEIDVSDPTNPVLARNIPIPNSGEQITESASGDELFVTASNAGAVYRISIPSGTVAATWTGVPSAHQAQIDSAGTHALVTTQTGSTTPIFDLATNTSSGSIPQSSTYYASADTSNGSTFVTAPFASGGQALVLDSATFAITQRISAPFAYYTATDSVRHRTFVTNLVNPTLTVIGLPVTPPTVTIDPSDVTVAEHGSANFSAAATGEPTPTIQWSQSTNGGFTWAPIPGATSTTLTIADAQLDQDGTLVRAEFTNSQGSATTNFATLTVAPIPPVVTLNPTDVSAGVGDDATFTASASGSQPLSVQWETSADAGASWTPALSDGSSTFTLTGVSLAQDGLLIRAVFSNAAGEATTEAARLSVTVSPTPPPTSTPPGPGPTTDVPRPPSTSTTSFAPPAGGSDLAGTGGGGGLPVAIALVAVGISLTVMRRLRLRP